MVLQENVEDKLEGRITNVEVLQRIKRKLTFHEQYEKEETGICMTCYEGF